MSNSLDNAVDSDITELTDTLQIQGDAALVTAVKDRVRQTPHGPMFYLLQDANGEVVAGNLLPFHGGEGRFDLKVQGADAPRVRVHAHGVALPDRGYLMVAVDSLPRTKARRLILLVFGCSAAASLVLAFGGGALMSMNSLRRIETISRTARHIMAGDFSRRIPVHGSEDEFDQLAISLNAMLERNEVAMESVRQVSNDIAHDLRTPLTRLRQRLELAQRRARSAEEWRQAAEECISDMDSIMETFSGLLRIAQIESGTPTRRFGKVDLSELLRTVVELYQPMAEEKQQMFAADIAAGLTVWGDRELLTQMIANVIENAMKHSPRGASIDLLTGETPNTIAVAVNDSGPGIPVEERAHVFQRFYRLERSRSTPGSGLGLSLVEAIAVLHDVSIKLTDNGPGLCVTLRFTRLTDQCFFERQLAEERPCQAGTSGSPYRRRA